MEEFEIDIVETKCHTNGAKIKAIGVSSVSFHVADIVQQESHLCFFGLFSDDFRGKTRGKTEKTEIQPPTPVGGRIP